MVVTAVKKRNKKRGRRGRRIIPRETNREGKGRTAVRREIEKSKRRGREECEGTRLREERKQDEGKRWSNNEKIEKGEMMID